MICEALLVGWLSVFVPPGFTASPVVAETVAPMAGPPGVMPVRVSNAVLTGDEAELRVTAFAGQPPYPGGPMVAAQRAELDVGGVILPVVRTSMFMGTAQVVTVVYPQETTGPGTAMIVVPDLPLADALPLLATALGGCPD